MSSEVTFPWSAISLAVADLHKHKHMIAAWTYVTWTCVTVDTHLRSQKRILLSKCALMMTLLQRRQDIYTHRSQSRRATCPMPRTVTTSLQLEPANSVLEPAQREGTPIHQLNITCSGGGGRGGLTGLVLEVPYLESSVMAASYLQQRQRGSSSSRE